MYSAPEERGVMFNPDFGGIEQAFVGCRIDLGHARLAGSSTADKGMLLSTSCSVPSS